MGLSGTTVSKIQIFETLHVINLQNMIADVRTYILTVSNDTHTHTNDFFFGRKHMLVCFDFNFG